MLVRILSAAIALPIVIALIELGGWAFAGLVLFAGAVCLWEVMTMTLGDDRVAQGVATVFGLGVTVATFVGYAASAYAIVIATGVTIGLLVLFLFRTGDMTTVGARVSFAITGILWAGVLLAATGLLRQLPSGNAWLYLACVLAWGSDTGGYFAGRFFGRHKLYEKVSPKKTWEGSVGGVIVATGGAFVVNALFGPFIDPVHLAVLAPAAAALGQIGDLAESLLKRSVGVKDSGRIMPGHGGLFDRVDALIFVGPALLAYAIVVQGSVPMWLGLP